MLRFATLLILCTVLWLFLQFSMASTHGNGTTNGLTNVHQKSTDNGTVIIIGSGMAGIGAARRLADETNLDVIVLEANTERYGGRIWSYEVPGYPGKPVEQGAMWLHGGADPHHPMTKLAHKFAIPLIKNDPASEYDETQIYDIQGKQLIDQNVSKMVQMLMLLIELRQNMTKSNSSDITFQTAFNILSQNYPQLKETLSNKSLGTVGMEVLMGSTKDQLSLLYSFGVPGSQEEILYDGYDLTGPKGYRLILDKLITAGRGFQLELARKVLSVNYDGTGSVRVTAVDTKSNEKHLYTADHVVVAVPLGVLKSHQIDFVPPLPGPHLTAINNIGFGNYVKVLLVYDEPFWPDKKFFFTESEDPTGLPFDFINLHKVHKLPALQSTINSDGAAVADKLPETEVIKRVTDRLEKMFGTKTVRSRKLLHTKVTRWRNDTLIGGAYSFGKIGMTTEDTYNIRTQIKPHLFFAGEHTAFPEGQPSTVNGAYMSGIRAANEIMKQRGLSAT